MASLVTRRQSGGSPPPRIVIPPRHVKEEVNDMAYEPSTPPAYELSTSTPEIHLSDQISPPSSPPVSGGLSPDLQPITPPVITRKSDKVLQIGKYLLLNQLDNHVFEAVNFHTNEEKICKVFTQETYRSKIGAYCRLYESLSVVQIDEIIQGNKFVYVFFNKHYGDLHSYVRSKKRLKEDEAKHLFRQIAEAVAQCHNSGVVVRDLKLRKFVFMDPERTRIQLEGLEDSHLLDDDDDDDTLRDKQGCPAYVSPEILEHAQCGYSGKASDQWSSGVMLYTMLIGRYPFQESEPTKLFEKIKLGNFNIPNVASSKAKCLIRNLLRRNASDRLTAEEVMHHPWLKMAPSSATLSLTSNRDSVVNDHMVPCV